MAGSAHSNNDIGEFERALPSVANNAHSLDEIEAWIRAHRCVKRVALADYLLKSNPPQRDLIIECGTKDGTVIKKILNIYVLSDQKFQFNSLRDQ
jgi:hypothetical protein